jgi:Na+-translocating ferredoxin:NAD+ oxidoreductase subunit B
LNSETATDLAARIDALLPQTQCTRCGYAGCAPYAEAIARGEAQINQCPPGGSETIAALATLLGLPVQALNPVHGRQTPPLVAWIDETRCIGCARCLAPCPVDAIVGAAKHMHTVLVERCTGCELCLPPCPVDCIELKPGPEPAADQPALNRMRFEAHGARLEHRARERQRELDAKKAAAPRQAQHLPGGP